MKSLGPIQLDTFQYYVAIVAAKKQPRRQRLNLLSAFVERRYQEYAQNTASLEPILPTKFTQEQIDDFVHCYNSSTSPLSGLKFDIEEHHYNAHPAVAALCQYCGLKYDPDEFDHYLPKEQFPEFSTLSLNLVPCCGDCNGLKGTAWLDSNGVRRIVSFYYDVLPEVRFLFADIELRGNLRRVPVAHFRLSENAADYSGLMTVIQNHFLKLELLERYRRAAYTKFSDIKVEMGPVVRSSGVAVAAEMLRKNAFNLSESRSANYWEVALIYAMAENVDYLNSLCDD